MTVLFVCVHNSARSQIAEAFTNALCAGKLRAYSAGLEPGRLNPYVVEAMREVGFDISANRTKGVGDPEIVACSYDYVVTVCDQGNAERCPLFTGPGERLHWSFPDPSAFSGTHAEILEQVRKVRAAIQAQITRWCLAVCA